MRGSNSPLTAPTHAAGVRRRCRGSPVRARFDFPVRVVRHVLGEQDCVCLTTTTSSTPAGACRRHRWRSRTGTLRRRPRMRTSRAVRYTQSHAIVKPTSMDTPGRAYRSRGIRALCLAEVASSRLVQLKKVFAVETLDSPKNDVWLTSQQRESSSCITAFRHYSCKTRGATWASDNDRNVRAET